MASEYELGLARPADAPGVAALFSTSWTSPFTRLQFGRVPSATLAQSMAPRIVQRMEKPHAAFVVARERAGGQVVAVAQWKLPSDEDAGGQGQGEGESEGEREERRRFEDEAYRNGLPEASNKDLIMDFSTGLRELRERVLERRRHYREFVLFSLCRVLVRVCPGLTLWGVSAGEPGYAS